MPRLLVEQPDAEELFLMSLAPRLRSLSEERRSLVKIEIMQALHSVEFP